MTKKQGEVTIGVAPGPGYERQGGKQRGLTTIADANPGVWVSRVLPSRGSGNSTYYKALGYECVTRGNPDGTRTFFLRRPAANNGAV